MNNHAVLIFLSCFIYVFAEEEKYGFPNVISTEPCYSAKEDRIVQGKIAPGGAFPYQASLRVRENYHVCGGSIISDRWILTAGHCLYGIDVTSVVVGTNTLNYGGDRYFVERAIVHQRYDPANIVNDVGLILLNENIRFYNVVHPIRLPLRDIDYDNYPAIVSGWGKIKANGPPSNKLQYLQTCLMDRSTCARKVPTTSVYQKICTFTFPGQGVCQGDSGSPLVADGVQIGITSYVVSNCAQGYPDYFTRVASFLGWIREHIKSY